MAGRFNRSVLAFNFVSLIFWNNDFGEIKLRLRLGGFKQIDALKKSWDGSEYFIISYFISIG